MTAPEPAPSEIGAVAFPAPVLAGALSRDFTADGITALRHAVQAAARQAGLIGEPLDDFAVAVQELMTNAVRHGGGRGRLELRVSGDNLVCDVIDHGPGFRDGVPAPSGPPPAETLGGRGLWLAGHLTDSMLISNGTGGTTVSISMCLPAAPPDVAAVQALHALTDRAPAMPGDEEPPSAGDEQEVRP